MPATGYLDLLKARARTPPPPKNTGAIQAAWASGLGSMLYDNAQAFARKVVSAWQLPIDWLDIPTGGVALDVGSGPGNVTASLARAAGPDGLALGVDISEPMLARAVSAEAGPNVGFLRADAQQLPFRDARFRRGDVAGRAAADPRPRGDAGGDRAGAQAGRQGRHHGADSRARRRAAAPAAQGRCPLLRRGRARRHIRGSRSGRRADEDARQHPMGARPGSPDEPGLVP